jgi:hypothetical protein
MKTVVYDIENFPNFISYYDVDVETGEEKVFVIHESRNELEQLVRYLEEPKISVGFNNVYYDREVKERLEYGYDRWKRMPVNEFLANFYRDMQVYMANEERGFYSGDSEIDLYLINHFNNKARSTSLKALQVSIFWHNVQDMPIHHETMITEDLIPQILDYNRNDVLSTKAFYDLCQDQINFRKQQTTILKKNMTNKPDTAIGEETFMHYLGKEAGLTKGMLKEMVREDHNIELSKCILPYVKFQSHEFNRLLDQVKWTIVNQNQKLIYSVNYKGFKYDYGVGGIHGCVIPGIYDSTSDKVIMDFDVKSYYPNLAIQNGLHPKHIPKDIFINTYQNIFEERVKAQIAKDSVKDAGLKLALNGIFGKTGERTSAFYDRYYFYSITLNGQLLLSMLGERYSDEVPGVEILQINTDGITIRVPRKHLDIVNNINERWMKVTKLILEHSEYRKLVIRDVNNYLALGMDGKIKKKGIFETEKQYHKDNSFLIVPKALEKYYLEHTPVEKTIYKCKNIYDFCGRYKAYKGWHAQYNYSSQGKVYTENHGRIHRFYPVSQGGGMSFKVNEDGRVHNLCAGQRTMKFNEAFKVDKFQDYNINYEFFVEECRKIMDEIEPKQLKLF